MTEPAVTPIIIEWPDQFGIQKAGLASNFAALQAQSEKALTAAMATIEAVAQRLSSTIGALDDAISPNEMEVEFGIKLDAETGAMLAKAAVGAQLTVRYHWYLKEPNQATVQIAAGTRDVVPSTK